MSNNKSDEYASAFGSYLRDEKRANAHELVNEVLNEQDKQAPDAERDQRGTR